MFQPVWLQNHIPKLIFKSILGNINCFHDKNNCYERFKKKTHAIAGTCQYHSQINNKAMIIINYHKNSKCTHGPCFEYINAKNPFATKSLVKLVKW